MVYVIYRSEQFLIDQEISKIENNLSLDKNSITRYDLENTKIETIIEDANQINLFSLNKLIIVDNAYIFTATTNKKLLKQNTEVLEQYLNNINKNTILIFNILKDKLDVRKKIYKLANTNGKIIECNNVSTINVVKNMFKGYNIDDSLIKLLINRVGNNLLILKEEADKIKTYKDDNTITREDIINLTNKNIDTDLFHLIDNIVENNKNAAIKSYHEMLKLGEEPLMILINLANQFRILYQVKRLSKQGLSELKIADILNIHSYRVKKALEKRNNFSDSKLINYLSALADLDYSIKIGKIDKEIGLEIFILNT